MKDGKPWLPDDISFEPGRVIPVPPGVNPSRVAEMLEAIRKERDERVQEAVGQAVLNIKTEQGGEVDPNGLSPQTPGVEGDRIETAGTWRVHRFSPFSPVNPCEGDPNGLSPHTPGAKLDQGKNRLDSSMLKKSNPKEFFGNQKLHLDVVPGCVEQYCSLALLEGALKYGRYNWRIQGVRVSTYISAAKRHLDKYVEGQWADPTTQVPHLASVLACVAIILDAGLMGTLTDDRPPSLPNHDQWIDAQTSVVAHLQELFKNHDPRQYVIGDTVLSPNAEATCPRQ